MSDFDKAYQRLITEDSVNPNTNRWVTGISTRAADGGKPDDIYQTMYDNQVKTAVHVHTLPVPLDKVIDQLGDIYVKCVDAKRTIFDARQNPVVRENSRSLKTLAKMNKKLGVITRLIQEIGTDLDTFSLASDEE